MAYINKKKIFFAGISKGISERYTEGVIVEDIETEGATNLITFTIGSKSYQAEQGMTWHKWCNSKYNTSPYVCASNTSGVLNGHTNVTTQGTWGTHVIGSDIIIANANYPTLDSGNGGSND